MDYTADLLARASAIRAELREMEINTPNLRDYQDNASEYYAALDRYYTIRQGLRTELEQLGAARMALRKEYDTPRAACIALQGEMGKYPSGSLPARALFGRYVMELGKL